MPAGGPPVGGPPAGGPPPGFDSQAPGNDPITGALNLPAFSQAFGKMAAMGAPEHAALWYVDIRQFRSINPKYGYLAGNMVLATTAEGIRKFLGGDLPLTRLGGDRFVFISGGKAFEEADAAFHDMVEFVNDKIKSEGVNNRILLIGGIYYLRESDLEKRDFRRALDYASISHRNARNNPHSSLVLFTDEDLERDTRRIIIEQSIDSALTDGQIEVWYQPQIDYSYGEVIGAEALARWNHPELGWISPAEFIPVLENCGKVHELDLFVWEEACRNAGRWRNASDGSPIPISVNVSRAEMFEPGLLQHFKRLQKKYDLPDGSLHIEITESAFVEEADRLYRIIEAMRKNDMVVEMDDFGSGLSSLNMLKDVPVDVVKLDMGFVRSGVNEDRGGVVLGSVIRMLQGLDTPIIAEGVETLEQAELLKNLGCHLMQGFHFSRPMPLDDFENFIGTNTTLENTQRRKRSNSHLDELLSFDKQSSYLFNEGIGGMIYFYIGAGTTESILVNDQFYEECGLTRDQFGDSKINPIEEVGEESRQTLWRAAAEAREYGSALCTAQVKKSGRWIEACMRYLGESSRGMILSLNILRSGSHVGSHRELIQALQDAEWSIGLLDRIIPHGFLKCLVDDALTIDYVSPQMLKDLDLTEDELEQRFHNSFIEVVAVADRGKLISAVNQAEQEDTLIDCDVRLYQGYGRQVNAQVVGRICEDGEGRELLYFLVLLKGAAEANGNGGEDVMFDRVIPFDYYLSSDKLVVHATLPDGSVRDITMEDWTKRLNDLPESIDPVSAAKAMATVRDLRHNPISGFTDLKCNLRGGRSLRWYHINYTCDADEAGNTTVIHGFAQDANDEMGSAKWWRKQAEICQLTGLLNRNAVEQRINLLMRTYGGGMMFMIDLDGFKRVNDELGHLTGDALLREVADVLSAHFRDSDALGRYGGDEFVAFMPTPETSDPRQLAQRRAEEIIEAVSKVKIPDGTHAACSVGVALASTGDASFYDLLEVADQALYVSKESGKSCATVHTM